MLHTGLEFQEFLNKNFQFIESLFEDKVDIYSSQYLRLRIVEEHNKELYIDISTKENPEVVEDWIMLGDLVSYILNNDDYINGSEFNDISFFFMQNYTKIVELLNTQYSPTLEALKKRGNKRAEILFGQNKSDKNKIF